MLTEYLKWKSFWLLSQRVTQFLSSEDNLWARTKHLVAAEQVTFVSRTAFFKNNFSDRTTIAFLCTGNLHDIVFQALKSTSFTYFIHLFIYYRHRFTLICSREQSTCPRSNSDPAAAGPWALAEARPFRQKATAPAVAISHFAARAAAAVVPSITANAKAISNLWTNSFDKLIIWNASVWFSIFDFNWRHTSLQKKKARKIPLDKYFLLV